MKTVPPAARLVISQGARIFAVLAAACFLPTVSIAAPVVDFAAGDYVSANTNSPRGAGTLTIVDLDADGLADDAQRLLAFSDTTPLSVSATGTSASGTYYGGFLLRYYNFLNGGNSTRPGGLNQLVNAADGTNDVHRLASNTGVTIPTPGSPSPTTAYATRGQATALFYWKQADGFVAGMQEGNIAVKSANAFSARLAAGGNNTGFTGRWLIRKGANFYVSAETFALSSATATNYSSTAIASTTWAPLDLSAGLPGVVGSYGPLVLEEIVGAGVYLSADVTAGGNVLHRVQLTSFSLEGELKTLPNPVGYHLGGAASYNAPYFANGLKTNTGWTPNTGGGVLTPATGRLNAQGYPTALLGAETYLSMGIWASSSIYQSPWSERDNKLNGKIVLTWTGDADLRLSAGTFVSGESSGASTGVLTNGRRVYQLTNANNVTARLYGFGATALTDAAAWLPDPASPTTQTLEGQLFHPTLLALTTARPWAYLRMMDWGETNASPQKDWSDRRLPNHSNYDGIINHRDPAEGAVDFYNSSNQPVYHAGDRATGVPWEVMVALGNAADRDIWICIPHLATDDYIDKVAKLLAYGSDGADPYTAPQASPIWAPVAAHRKVYVEYSNEIWAANTNFAQGDWAQMQADAQGITRAQFIARRSSRIWELMEAQLGAARVVRLAPARTADANGYTTQLLTELRDNPALLKPEFMNMTTYFGYSIQNWALAKAVAQAGPVDPWFATGSSFTSGTEQRPVTLAHTDPYWTGTEIQGHLEQTLRQMATYALSGTSFSATTGQDVVAEIGGFPESIATVAAAFNLPIIAYEGGPSIYTDDLDGGDTRDDGITHFMSALNRHPGFADVYRIVMEMSFAKGLVTHSAFVDVSKWGKFGQWGHLEYLTQPQASATKWQYMLELFDEQSQLRRVIDPKGAVPSFTTADALPRAEVGLAYPPVTVGTTGGDGARTVTLIYSLLTPGLTFDLPTLTFSGTPTAGGYNYVLLRVQDADGDCAWRIFKFQTVQRSADAPLMVDFQSLTPGAEYTQPFEHQSMDFETTSTSTTALNLKVAGVSVAGNFTLSGWESTSLLTRAHNIAHVFRRHDGHPFDLYQLDVASHQATTVVVTGLVQGGDTISQTFTIPMQKTPFTAITLDWVQMSWVQVEFFNGTSRTWGVIDNLLINQIP